MLVILVKKNGTSTQNYTTYGRLSLDSLTQASKGYDDDIDNATTQSCYSYVTDTDNID